MVSMFKEEYSEFSIFSGLTAEQIQLLCSLLDYCHFSQGLVIFDQGQAATNLFILLSGEVVVHYKPYDGPPLTVARIQPGGVFGWSAALGRDLYTSAALAESECDAFRISGADLHQFCMHHPQVGVVVLDQLASVIAKRLQNTHTEILTILTKGMDLDDECWRRLKKDD